MSDDHLISLAGDMWNELENLRDLWTGTDREPQCEQLIADYESLAGVARGEKRLLPYGGVFVVPAVIKARNFYGTPYWKFAAVVACAAAFLWLVMWTAGR